MVTERAERAEAALAALRAMPENQVVVAAAYRAFVNDEVDDSRVAFAHALRAALAAAEAREQGEEG